MTQPQAHPRESSQGPKTTYPINKWLLHNISAKTKALIGSCQAGPNFTDPNPR